MFEGLKPATAETCEALIVTRFRQYLHSAIESARYGERDRFNRFMGIAEGQVSVLYDFGHRHCYRYLSALRRLQAYQDRKINHAT